jgi:hypothetical protein
MVFDEAIMTRETSEKADGRRKLPGDKRPVEIPT